MVSIDEALMMVSIDEVYSKSIFLIAIFSDVHELVASDQERLDIRQ